MTSIFVCGDVLNYENETGEVCSPEMAKIIVASDYAVCNFEAPVTGFGVPQVKYGPHHYQRIETITGLKQQGFNLLLLANNHIMDFGEEGLSSTINVAQKAGLDFIGAGLDFQSAYRPLVKQINEMKIGMVNACEANFGVIDHFKRASNAGYAWINHPEIDKLILHLKNESDFILVFAHAGLEHYPIPQIEWRERYKHFCDLGADVVFGSHPHVPQGYEYYRESIIFYSLGNFYFDSNNFRNKEDCSFGVLLKLSKNNRLIEFEPVYHHTQNGYVQLSPPDKQIDLQDLCLRLEKDYQKQHDEMSLAVYERIKQELILSLLPIPYTGKMISSFRRTASILLGRTQEFDKDLTQLHLLRNEANYFAARHALELKAKEKYFNS